jgi:competence protein ComEC
MRFFTLYILILSVLFSLRFIFFGLNEIDLDYKIFSYLHKDLYSNLQSYLPSPHLELLLGMTVGIDELYNIPAFKEALKDTGTIHVVVVSGFNISLVLNVISSVFGGPYNKFSFYLSSLFLFFYCLFVGFSPPVFRSMLMGYLIFLAKHKGRELNILKILFWVVGFSIVFIPSYISNISFLLSVSATLGLILIAPLIEDKMKALKFFGKEDFIASVAAQVLVTPIILYNFERLSLVSVLVNSLVLWTVPLITVIGFILLVSVYLSPYISTILCLFLYPFLDFFVSFVRLFGKFSWASIEVNFFSVNFVVIYYLICFLWLKRYLRF